MRKDIHRRIHAIATKTAEAAGATAEITLGLGYPATINDPALTERMAPTLQRVAGADNVRLSALTGTAEDFSFYGTQAPSLFFWVGITPPDRDPEKAAFNHSPLFYIDEPGMAVGMRAMLNVAVDYLQQPR